MADSRIDELRRRLERDPESRLFAQLAEELRKEGELEESIGVARTGLEKHPNYPSARLTLGRALLDSGDPAAARVELEAAVGGAPDNILASRLLGEALETLGDLGSALEQYQRTLQMAPGDGHVEARVRAIQTRLGAPGEAEGREETPSVTAPMKAVAEGDEEEEGELPPTIRIRMPGDAPRPGRAPLPPVPGGAGRGETTLPRRPTSMATEGETTASELPATLPMPGAKPTEEADAEAADVTDETSSPESGSSAPAESPVSRPAAPEVEDEEPTAPEASALEAPDFEVPPAVEPPPTEEAPPDGTLSVEDEHAAPEAEEPPGTPAEPPGADVVPPDLAPTLPKSRAAEYALEGFAPSPTPQGGEEAAPQTPPSEEPAAATPDGPALSSATLAELYFEQGLLERAVEVYRQVLEEEPGNEGARARLAELETLMSEAATELPAPGEREEGDTAARRRALERTIERLEALLEIVRRR